MTFQWRWTCLATYAVLAVVGCDDQTVRVYRAPKSTNTSTVPASSAADSTDVRWTMPMGWRATPSDQPMRVATFRAGPGEGVEVSITAFPGDVGGTLANINRWRGQLGLPPVQDQDLAGMLSAVSVAGIDVSTLSIASPNGQEMLGAIIHPGDGKTWFVKATAESKVAAEIKDSFVAFAQSFRKGPAGRANSPSQAPAPPAGTIMPADHGSLLSADSIDGRLQVWQAPAHWKPEAGSAGIVAAIYNATNADGGARATATSLLNDGGGTLANINRWRDQMGLAAVESLDTQPKTELGKGALSVDLTDAPGARRMIAVIVPSGGQSWFFKLTGSPKGVETEKPSFDLFVKRVGLGEP